MTAYPPASYIKERFDGFERNIKSIDIYIQRLETDMLDRMSRLDRLFDERVQAILTTAPDLGLRFEDLRQRVVMLEDTVNWHERVNAPEPPVDTSWHPYEAVLNGTDGAHPTGDKRVAVLLRNGEINRPDRADAWDWSECTHRTIVAWRYAKEGE
jgi:hypothetical protein